MSEPIRTAAEAIARIRNPWAQSPDVIVDPDEYDTCLQYARAAVNAAEAIIRADERAKVAEDIAKSIEAQWDNYEPEWTEALRHLAAIARQHA